MDFYDLKGILAGLFDGLHLQDVSYEPEEHPSFHPGKTARVLVGGVPVGVLGELHPLVREHYELPPAPLLAAELDLESIMPQVTSTYDARPVPAFPPVLEDLAVVVDEDLPAARVAAVIAAAGGELVFDVRLFDVYRSEALGAGKKSLAYSLTFQAPARTLTDDEVAQVRQRIIRRLEGELGAKLRS
jgi:phenylalanyl-tRNA synthetase beta chain